MSDLPISFEDSDWPLVHCRFHRPPRPDELTRYTTLLEGWAARGPFARVVVWGDPWQVLQRTQIYNWYINISPNIAANMIALAYVPLTKRAELSLRAALWGTGSTKTGKIFSSVETATDWARAEITRHYRGIDASSHE